MTDWISDAEAACEIVGDGAFGNTLTQQQARNKMAAALPRALAALRAAEKLLAQYSQLLPTDLPPGAELRLERAEDAYRKARS